MDPADEERSPARPGVLVVDDYAANLTALGALLAPIAPVTAVESGRRALEEIARRDFAVVVLDVQMPRMDGLEVAMRMRTDGDRNARVPIIFLTAADGGSQQMLEGYAAGAVDYLRRPFEPFVLQSKVAIFVELHQRREQARREAAARVRLEAERQAAQQASREKDRFLATLSHELRTPLTSILLWSDMLLNKQLPPDMVRRGLETLDVCARQQAHLVENVLEMSRLVQGKLSLELGVVDVDELMDEVTNEVQGLAGDRQVRVARSPQRTGAAVVGDRVRLRQVLYNLLDNAVKFTPAGGAVAVTSVATPAGLTVRVDDTGAGFDPHQAGQLFARFERGGAPRGDDDRSGLGVGLTVARALVELHGGSISAASPGVGRGASFTVTLPARGGR